MQAKSGGGDGGGGAAGGGGGGIETDEEMMIEACNDAQKEKPCKHLNCYKFSITGQWANTSIKGKKKRTNLKTYTRKPKLETRH